MNAIAEARLIERWQRNGDHAAREQLVERYRGLVRALAARHSEWGEPFDDLLQVAWIGFLKALDRFDPSREVKLATYATATIVGELRRHYRDRAWAVHVPRSVRELRARVFAVVDQLTSELGASPTVADIAKELSVGEEEVLDAMQAGGARAARTLAPLSEDGESEIDVPYRDPAFAESEARMLVHEGLDLLDDRERRIIAMRFEEGLTQSQIASRIGISQMHVSRLLRRALETLREQVGEIGPQPDEE
jgi:RNA polymerase sigma-B factor